MRLGRGTVTHCPPTTNRGLKDIGHSMSMVLNTKKSAFKSQQWFAVSNLIHYYTSLHNARDIITKCDNYFLTKCDKSLLQNASGFDYKMRQFYYKMRRSLQNGWIYSHIITKSTFRMLHLYRCSIKKEILFLKIRSNRSQMFFKIGVLKNF